MRTVNFFLLLSLVISFTRCSINEEELIIDFEANTNNIQISNILKKETIEPYYAHDSILVLDRLYKLTLTNKQETLLLQYKTALNKWQNANRELHTISNPLMHKAYGHKVVELKYRKDQIEKIMAIYHAHPEQTQLNKFIVKKQFYANSPDSILGYTLKVFFKGKLGALKTQTYQRNYFLSPEKDKIMAVIER